MLYKHVMIDLKTLASSGKAAIISIGAVCFDPETNTLGPEIKINVDGESSQRHGGEIEAGTVAWWFKQTKEARDALTDPKPVNLPLALTQLGKWFQTNLEGRFSPWGNGANFDNVILRYAYECAELPVPWSYTSDKCYRTMSNMFPQIPRGAFKTGTAHDSLSDARSQALHLNAIFKYLNEKIKMASVLNEPPSLS